MLGKSMYNSAIKAAKQNMEFEPDVTLLIVQLYGRLGMLDSANFFLNKIIIPANPEKTNARKAFHIGEMYFAIGKINLSIVWFESALKRNYGWRALKYDSEFNDANKYPSIQKLIEKYKPSYN